MRIANAALMLALLAAGCKAKDGDILAQVFHRTGQKIGAAAGDGPARVVSRLRASAGEASLAARVSNRIHWDRYLAKLDIEVSTTAAGVVTLRGAVPDRSIRQRVLDLARSTTGVQRVDDRLTLPNEE
jgi:osmotically-inducible protein OsmY